MPHATGTHTDGHPVVYDSGDYELLLDKTLAAAGWEELRAWRSEEPGPRHRRGLGVGLFVEKSGIGRWEYARVDLTSEGRTAVHSGGASVGQGLETTLAQVCAEALGVPYDDVSVLHGDTRDVPDGMGAFGSRAATLGGSAVLEGATRLRTRILDLAGRVLEIDPGDLEIRATAWSRVEPSRAR
jgi:CO/xanthine dehydrogenase Mo-binding subunit